jgi:uncharacterized protein YndB with AHSA1/START domain
MPAKLLNVEMQLRISKPPRVVFEAIVDPKQMSEYFTSSGTGRLDCDSPVTWRFADVGAKLVIRPQRVVANRSVSFRWRASKVDTLVVIELKPLGKSATLVKVFESGWSRDSKGIARCIGQTRGWAHMLSCMKAYLEHGVHLRKGGTLK